jgi:MerR family transcriptional regulator/heat shock protein HspR
MVEQDRNEPRYAIRVVAEMICSHPQTLRLYERSGLVVPRRTRGNARLYSERDIERIRHIQTYTAMGVNLAGIDVIFRLLERIEQLEAQVASRDSAELRRREAELTEELRSRLRGKE